MIAYLILLVRLFLSSSVEKNMPCYYIFSGFYFFFYFLTVPKCPMNKKKKI